MSERGLRWLSRCSLAALGLVAASALLPVPVRAAQHGTGLMVAPTRVVFEGDKRTAAVTLVNTGAETATYRVLFVQRRMREDGGLEPIDTPGAGERFADRLVYFAPRMVVLPPGGQQTVRLQLRKPAGLEPGEYRSHLLFQAVPAGASGNDIEQLASGGAAADEPSQVSIRLTAVFGVTIPVIVRHGQTTARVSLSDLRWEMDPATGTPRALSVRIGRTGNRSVYGDVTVSLVAADGREQVIGSINGIAVYTPNPYRLLKVPVQVPAGSLSRGARLRVTYRNGEDSGSRILAQVEVAVP